MTQNVTSSYDALILGAGAAGLFCAQALVKKGLKVLILEHEDRPGKKILISGGGRCNFTNINASAANYLSNNPHFCKSALARFTPRDFLKFVENHRIKYFEKELGQLFCEHSSKAILNMLLKECESTGFKLQTGTTARTFRKTEDGFEVKTGFEDFKASHLVVATGGLSFPKLGASDLGYRIAKQFGLDIVPPRDGLVPFEGDSLFKKSFSRISGVSFRAKVSVGKTSFTHDVLVTHSGLSGPAILQISSYWRQGESITMDLLPGTPIEDLLLQAKQSGTKTHLHNFLAQYLPDRFVNQWLEYQRIPSKPVNELGDKALKQIAQNLTHWRVQPKATLGYEKAEVTLGGVATGELSSQTLESQKVPGLYFIGEVVDVTGWLGGYNFQWAWASAQAAAEAIIAKSPAAP